MSATTTHYGWTYPTSTDYVKDGATAMGTLATSIDSSLYTVATSTPTSGLTLITTSTISAATTVNINNCFSSTYKNYRIHVYGQGTGNSQVIYFKLRTSGTDSTTGYVAGTYGFDIAGTGSSVYRTTGGAGGAATVFDMGYICGSTSVYSMWAFDLINPHEATFSSANGTFTTINNGSWWYGGGMAGNHLVATAYDGISFISTGNWTGTIKIYGYNS